MKLLRGHTTNKELWRHAANSIEHRWWWHVHIGYSVLRESLPHKAANSVVESHLKNLHLCTSPFSKSVGLILNKSNIYNTELVISIEEMRCSLKNKHTCKLLFGLPLYSFEQLRLMLMYCVWYHAYLQTEVIYVTNWLYVIKWVWFPKPN